MLPSSSTRPWPTHIYSSRREAAGGVGGSESIGEDVGGGDGGKYGSCGTVFSPEAEAYDSMPSHKRGDARREAVGGVGGSEAIGSTAQARR